MPVVEIVRPEGTAFDVGVIKPGHTVVAVNDRSLLNLSMQESAKIIAEAAQKVKDSQGRVPCVVRFMKTTNLLPEDGDAAASPEPVKKSLLARCFPFFKGGQGAKGGQDSQGSKSSSKAAASGSGAPAGKAKKP